MYRDMYTHKWTFVGTYKYTYMLRKIRGKEYEFLETQYLLFIHVYYYIFFWGVMLRIFAILFLVVRCNVRIL